MAAYVPALEEEEESRLMANESESDIRHAGNRRWHSKSRHYCSYLREYSNQLFASVVVMLLVANLIVVISLKNQNSPQQAFDGQQQNLSYGSDAKYMSLDRKYDALWDEIRPNNGIISLPPWGPDGKSIAGHYGHIGMLHHLHCLAILRNALQRSHDGENIGLDHTQTELHWPHCMYYMRRAILCAADDTIELAHYENGTVELTANEPSFIDGRLDVRQCGDAETLFELRRQHGISEHSI